MKPRKQCTTKTLWVLVVHYSLSFTAYKAVSEGVFLRCGTLSLGYNYTSWPCAKMVSTIKGVLVVYYFLGFIAYKAASGRVFLRCGTLSLGYNCTSWLCTKMVSTLTIWKKSSSILIIFFSFEKNMYISLPFKREHQMIFYLFYFILCVKLCKIIYV